MADNKDIRFPEHSGDIILDVLNKYDLAETPEEEMRKIDEGEKPNGRKIADLLRSVAQGNMKVSELSSGLKKELKTSKKKAESIAEELKERILDFVLSEKAEVSSSNPSAATAPPSSPSAEQGYKKDPYREPIE